MKKYNDFLNELNNSTYKSAADKLTKFNNYDNDFEDKTL